jgi:hypothetical protein
MLHLYTAACSKQSSQWELRSRPILSMPQPYIRLLVQCVDDGTWQLWHARPSSYRRRRNATICKLRWSAGDHGSVAIDRNIICMACMWGWGCTSLCSQGWLAGWYLRKLIVHEVRIGRFSLWLHDYLIFSCKASDGVRDLATELLLCSEVMLETARVKSVLIFLRKKKT